MSKFVTKKFIGKKNNNSNNSNNSNNLNNLDNLKNTKDSNNLRNIINISENIQKEKKNNKSDKDQIKNINNINVNQIFTKTKEQIQIQNKQIHKNINTNIISKNENINQNTKLKHLLNKDDLIETEKTKIIIQDSQEIKTHSYIFFQNNEILTDIKLYYSNIIGEVKTFLLLTNYEVIVSIIDNGNIQVGCFILDNYNTSRTLIFTKYGYKNYSFSFNDSVLFNNIFFINKISKKINLDYDIYKTKDILDIKIYGNLNLILFKNLLLILDNTNDNNINILNFFKQDFSNYKIISFKNQIILSNYKKILILEKDKNNKISILNEFIINHIDICSNNNHIFILLKDKIQIISKNNINETIDFNITNVESIKCNDEFLILLSKNKLIIYKLENFCLFQELIFNENINNFQNFDNSNDINIKYNLYFSLNGKVIIATEYKNNKNKIYYSIQNKKFYSDFQELKIFDFDSNIQIIFQDELNASLNASGTTLLISDSKYNENNGSVWCFTLDNNYNFIQRTRNISSYNKLNFGKHMEINSEGNVGIVSDESNIYFLG